ncbi:MAG: DUF4150 domain-containing protein [Planctomycetota bacterium]|jgi:hypothetical protein
MVAIFPASTKASGQAMGMPDVCKVPAPPLPSPVPTPFPNIGMLATATDQSTKVKFMSVAAVTMKSKIPASQGDEAGVAGGMVSGSNLGEVQFKKGSSKVKVEGQSVIHLTSMTSHNGSNANMPAGTQIAPSQTKVIVAP